MIFRVVFMIKRTRTEARLDELQDIIEFWQLSFYKSGILLVRVLIDLLLWINFELPA